MDNTLLGGNSHFGGMPPTPQPVPTPSSRGRLTPKKIAGLGVSLVIVVAAVYLSVKTPSGLAASSGPDNRAYQAVFLDNNQVYFGKLKGTSGQWLKLSDVYYLQENQPVAPAKKGEPQPRFTLLKLGRQELHGPTDMMVFNREHVLFWENIKNDSEVVKKIGEDKEQQKK